MNEEQYQQVRHLLGRSGKRRHPAEVTAERLGYTVGRFADKFDPAERDMIGEIIWALEQIADGQR